MIRLIAAAMTAAITAGWTPASIAGAALMLAATPALAEEAALQDNQVKRFVETLDPVEAFSDRLGDEARFDDMMEEVRPQQGKNFRPYSEGVAALKKKFPAEYAALGEVVKPHGFSQESWAATGDRVMVAYMALRMEQENPEFRSRTPQIDPAQLAQMPAEIRASIETSMAIMDVVKNAPAADQAAVRPHMTAIGKAIED